MSNSDLRRAWKAQQATKQDVTNAIPALMGNGHGVVQVPNQPGYVYIRLGQGDLGQAYNNRCPLTDNLAIYVGYDPVLDPDRRIFQVLSVRMADYAGAGGTPTPNVPPHHLTHEYGGGDDVYVSWRRLMGFRVGRPSGFQVTIDEGVMIRAGAWLSVTAQTLDLTALKPAGNLGCYVLIVLNAAGVVTATAGASVAIGTLDISDCPIPGASEIPLAAVRLYGAQTAIGDVPTAPDIIDLRFPQSTSTGDVHLEDLSDYARGHIIRGGAADWESYHAANAGFIVQGDGTDVKSLQFDWDTFSAGAGADMVHDHSDDSEGGLLSGGGGGGGGSYTFYLSNIPTALWPRSLQPVQDIAWNGANAVSDAIDKLVEYFYAPVDSISYVYAGTASFHLYAGVNVGDPGNTDELANLVVKLYKRLADTSLVLITQATVINYTRYAAYNHIIVTGAIAASYNFAPGDTLVLGLFTSPQTFPSGLTYSTVFELFGYGGVGVTLTGSGWTPGGHVIQDNGSNMPQEMKLNFIGATVADDPANNRTNVTLSSTIDLEDLSDYARGSIIRGGAADWEAYNAKTAGYIVQGDGTDVKSAAFDWDTIGAGAGADMVHDHTTSAEGGALSIGGGNPAFGVDGALVVETDVGAYIVPTTGTIAYVFIYCKTPGTASSTIVDVHKNGVTIFTTQASRPTLAWNDADQVAKSGVPDIAAIAENDVLTVDIDQIATGAADLTVVIQMSQSSGGSGGIPASPADIYVSASGDDSNDGLTTATPLETLQAAVNMVESTYDRDVTIHVASGDHLLTGTTVEDKRPLYPGDHLLIRGYLNAADDQFTDAADFSGTFSAGATNGWPTATSRATDATKNFGGADAMKLSLLHLTGGPGYDATTDEFNWYAIDSSGATTLDIAGNWNGATPTNATTYEVFNINNNRLYGNAANSAPMITISGSQNIVLRFMQILNGTLAWGPGTAGYHTVKVLSHSMTAQPTGYQGVSNPDLIWLGLLLGTPGTDSWPLMIQDSQLAMWASSVSGWTSSGLVTGNIAFSGQLDLRQVIIENADVFGIYAVGGTLTYFNGRVENNTETAGFRAGICIDARSLITEGHSLIVKDSYIGIYSIATSHVYLAGNNLIDSNGGDGVLSEASSQVELNGAGNNVSNNGGYGAHAIHNSAGNVSGATYAGNVSGTYVADASSAVW